MSGSPNCRDGRIGKVDAKTLKVTKWIPPTATGTPRRIEIDGDGIVWFAEFEAGKISAFDPEPSASRNTPSPARGRRRTRSVSAAIT